MVGATATRAGGYLPGLTWLAAGAGLWRPRLSADNSRGTETLTINPQLRELGVGGNKVSVGLLPCRQGLTIRAVTSSNTKADDPADPLYVCVGVASEGMRQSLYKAWFWTL